MRFSEAIKQHEEALGIEVAKGTIRGYSYDLRQVALFLRDPEIEEVELRDIIQMFRLMMILEWKQNSFTPKAAALKKFFKFWKRQGLNVIDPELIPRPKREFNPPKVAKQDDLQKLIDHVRAKTEAKLTRPKDKAGRWRDIRNLALILMLRDTGARIGELLSLNLKQILEAERLNPEDVIGGEEVWGAILKTEKSRGIRPYRQVFWKRETNEALNNWLKARQELTERWKNDFMHKEALFIGTSRYQHGKRLEPSSASIILRKYCKEIEIPTINAHSLRHLFCHNIVKHQHGSAADVMNLAGHATLASSTPYTAMFGRELGERYRVIHANGNGKGALYGEPQPHPYGALKTNGKLPFKKNYERT